MPTSLFLDAPFCFWTWWTPHRNGEPASPILTPSLLSRNVQVCPPCRPSRHKQRSVMQARVVFGFFLVTSSIAVRGHCGSTRAFHLHLRHPSQPLCSLKSQDFIQTRRAISQMAILFLFSVPSPSLLRLFSVSSPMRSLHLHFRSDPSPLSYRGTCSILLKCTALAHNRAAIPFL